MQDIAVIDRKIAQLKAQRQSIISREKERERKERTRRLIQVGAVIEKYLEIHSADEAERLCKFLVSKKENLAEIKTVIMQNNNTENEE